MRFEFNKLPACLLLALTMIPALSQAQKVQPVASGNNYKLIAGPDTLTVGPAAAGRIRSLKYQGTELLLASGTLNWGSTFWPSPQAYWTTACKNTINNGCWPPPVNLDADATNYTGGLVASDTTVAYVGIADNVATGTHLSFRKKFWANAKDSSFTNHYTMINTFTSSVAYAPWEITRFPGGGLTFYPTGSDTLRGTQALRNMTRDTLGVRWTVYDSATVPAGGTPKIWGDGGTPGWYAHVDKNRVLFIKKFKDTPFAKNAPYNTSESECELYMANAKNYQEMELQGSFDTIPANDSSTWDVKWFARKLPDSVSIGRNSGLLNFVNQVISGSLTAIKISAAPSIGFDGSHSFASLTLEKETLISLSLVNLQGREISRIYTGRLSAGQHRFSLNTEHLSSGVHWLVVRDLTNGQLLSQRMKVRLRN